MRRRPPSPWSIATLSIAALWIACGPALPPPQEAALAPPQGSAWSSWPLDERLEPTGCEGPDCFPACRVAIERQRDGELHSRSLHWTGGTRRVRITRVVDGELIAHADVTDGTRSLTSMLVVSPGDGPLPSDAAVLRMLAHPSRPQLAPLPAGLLHRTLEDRRAEGRTRLLAEAGGRRVTWRARRVDEEDGLLHRMRQGDRIRATTSEALVGEHHRVLRTRHASDERMTRLDARQLREALSESSEPARVLRRSIIIDEDFDDHGRLIRERVRRQPVPQSRSEPQESVREFEQTALGQPRPVRPPPRATALGFEPPPPIETRDRHGLLLSVRSSRGFALSALRDERGRLEHQVSRRFGGSAQTHRFTYDAAGRLRRLEVDGEVDREVVGEWEWTERGQLRRETLTERDPTSTVQVVVAREHDARGRLLRASRSLTTQRHEHATDEERIGRAERATQAIVTFTYAGCDDEEVELPEEIEVAAELTRAYR